MKSKYLKICIATLFFATLGAAVMLLWNILVVDVTSCTRVNYWQALGLLALSRIFLGKLHLSSSHPSQRKAKHELRETLKGMNKEARREYIKNYMSEKSSKTDE